MSRPHPLLVVMLVVVSDSSYCPTSDSCESETVVKEGLVIHPQPVTGTGPPEALKPVCSAVWSNSVVISNRVVFVKLSQIGVFVDSINNIRGCKSLGCVGNLVPVAVKSTGMGRGLSVCFGCDGCKVKFTRYENEPAYNNDISVSVQVTFILAGSTHTTYCKTLQNALGMKTVNANVFY